MRLDIPACPLLLLLPLLLLSIMAMIMPGVLFRRSRFVVFFFFLYFFFFAVTVVVAAAAVVVVALNQTGSVGRGATATAAAEERHISHAESRTLLLFSAHFELKRKKKNQHKLTPHAARFGGDKQESGGLSVNPDPGRKFPLPSDLTRVIFYLLRPEKKKKKKILGASHVF